MSLIVCKLQLNKAPRGGAALFHLCSTNAAVWQVGSAAAVCKLVQSLLTVAVLNARLRATVRQSLSVVTLTRSLLLV
jgi:hypothetical protein